MRRSRRDIIGNVLEVCLLDASKTRIVYSSSLNFRTVNPCLNSLTERGFIATKDGKYRTTDKGRELLAVIKEVHEFF